MRKLGTSSLQTVLWIKKTPFLAAALEKLFISLYKQRLSQQSHPRLSKSCFWKVWESSYDIWNSQPSSVQVPIHYPKFREKLRLGGKIHHTADSPFTKAHPEILPRQREKRMWSKPLFLGYLRMVSSTSRYSTHLTDSDIPTLDKPEFSRLPRACR